MRNRKDVDGGGGGGGGGEFESVDAEEINIDRTATGDWRLPLRRTSIQVAIAAVRGRATVGSRQAATVGPQIGLLLISTIGCSGLGSDFFYFSCLLRTGCLINGRHQLSGQQASESMTLLVSSSASMRHYLYLFLRHFLSGGATC